MKDVIKELHGDRNANFKTQSEPINQQIENFLQSDLTDDAELENLITTFATALKGVPHEDGPVTEDIDSCTSSLSEIANEYYT